MGKLNSGYSIRIETVDGRTKEFNCKNYQHINQGLLLSFEDKPDLIIEKSTYVRSFVGPLKESNGQIQLNS